MRATSAAPGREAAGKLIAKYRDQPALAGNASLLLPRLVAYTREDKAAKGLRSLAAPKTAPEVPIHFTALEMVQEERCLMLMAPPGAGKTTLALHLALNLAGQLIGDPHFNHNQLAGMPIRNAEGDVAAHEWQLPPTLPCYIALQGRFTLTQILQEAGAGFAAAMAQNNPLPLLILDQVESLGDGWWEFATSLMRLGEEYTSLRILLLGETRVVVGLPLPEGMVRHALLPLPKIERQRALPTAKAPGNAAALGKAADHAGLFALAREFGGQDDSLEAIIDAWYAALPVGRQPTPHWLEPLRIAKECAARGDVASAIALFYADHNTATPAITSLLARWQAAPKLRNTLMEGLIHLPNEAGLRGALLAAEMTDSAPELCRSIKQALHNIVCLGALAPSERVAAGCTLSRLGDPRDLEMLIDIPGGTFTMGSDRQPNSSPTHRVVVKPFRMSADPVTNGGYAAFVALTGRPWASPNGTLPIRANMPATDLTWHDARAYCAWLTDAWRKAGRIPGDAVVRLPTEAEWERAARGDQGETPNGFIHPWGSSWDNDRVNGDSLGINDICAVGLFPRGRGPFGCYDMAGQVWEWCSTLWGENMA